LPRIFLTNYPQPQEAFTLFPSEEIKFNISGHSLSQQQIVLARTGTEYQAVIWGIFFYRDAFSTPHYTRFCWLFRGEHMTENDAEACLGHNDSN
jgi:hypothetical protein